MSAPSAQISTRMPQSPIPTTEVIIAADCWQDQPDAEDVIHRAILAAANNPLVTLAAGMDEGADKAAELANA